ncbi:MAG TPA: hypothetical protein PLJ24_10320, partial [Anaerolineae bacterium]|nr:hypothetical protein [Anaerolineae bacterium]
GEGAGGGAKVPAYKGSSIAVELPHARLNYDRTFSSLASVRQHMMSPSKAAIPCREICENLCHLCIYGGTKFPLGG